MLYSDLILLTISYHFNSLNNSANNNEKINSRDLHLKRKQNEYRIEAGYQENIWRSDPGGIRTPDLHRDRVACLSTTPRGHSNSLRYLEIANKSSINYSLSRAICRVKLVSIGGWGYGGRYRTRTYDPLRVNCKQRLFSIVFEAKLLFCAYPYFSLKNPFFDLSLKIISAKLVPFIKKALMQ